MLLKGDPKKIATVIVSRNVNKEGKPSESVSSPAEKDGAELDSDPGLSAAADEILSAVEAKDAGALMGALKSFVSMCSYESESEEG